MTNKPSPIPPDDLNRTLTLSRLNDPAVPVLAQAGGTYTILLTGAQTGGRYCLFDMLIPPGGGPPPHRHDFEEMFTVLDGELHFTFRGETMKAGAGSTINIPSNAPHSFKNHSDQPVHMLCMCTPPGQEDYFLAVGDMLPTRATPPPRLTPAEMAERRQRALALASKFKTEFVT
jgi:quercetin dioxygenase-like cupin family protein